MSLLDELLAVNEKIDFLFPNTFVQLMKDPYYDYDKFEWFIYYVFKLEGEPIEKNGKKGQGDGGVDLIITNELKTGGIKRIGIQAKYWKHKVGVNEINQLSSAKITHGLTDLMIISTADLTNEALNLCQKMNIVVLEKGHIESFIQRIIKIHDDEIKSNGYSKINFLKNNDKPYPIPNISNSVFVNSDKEWKLIKKFRKELSLKYDLYPLYNVFSDEVANELLLRRPMNHLDLSKVKGIGPFKTELMGSDIIDFFSKNYGLKNKKTTSELVYYSLLKNKKKIKEFNNLEITDLYTDETALIISNKLPVNINELILLNVLTERQLEIYGEHIIRIILVETL